MMTFKIKTVSILLIFFSVSTFAQQTEKTLVKSFNIDNIDEVTLDLKGDVEVKHWNNKVMRVQMTIALQNGSTPMLKSLITAGRYNLDSKSEEETYTIYAPSMSREIKLKGEPLQEKIAYTVFAPEHVSIKLADDASTSKEDVKDLNSL